MKVIVYAHSRRGLLQPIPAELLPPRDDGKIAIQTDEMHPRSAERVVRVRWDGTPFSGAYERWKRQAEQDPEYVWHNPYLRRAATAKSQQDAAIYEAMRQGRRIARKGAR